MTATSPPTSTNDPNERAIRRPRPSGSPVPPRIDSVPKARKQKTSTKRQIIASVIVVLAIVAIGAVVLVSNEGYKNGHIDGVAETTCKLKQQAAQDQFRAYVTLKGLNVPDPQFDQAPSGGCADLVVSWKSTDANGVTLTCDKLTLKPSDADHPLAYVDTGAKCISSHVADVSVGAAPVTTKP